MQLHSNKNESETVEAILREFPENTETFFDIMDGEDGEKKLVYSHRKLNPEPPAEPERARTPKRSHTFHDIDAFARYLLREASEDACVVLADASQRCISAVLNERADKGVEIVDFRAQYHPLFESWLTLLLKCETSPIPAADFALFAMKHRRAIKAPDGRELAMVFSQIKMSKALEVSSGVGKKAINGVVATIEIAGQKQNELIELPDGIVIEVPLFLGTEAASIELDLLVTEHRMRPVCLSV